MRSGVAPPPTQAYPWPVTQQSQHYPLASQQLQRQTAQMAQPATSTYTGFQPSYLAPPVARPTSTTLPHAATTAAAEPQQPPAAQQQQGAGGKDHKSSDENFQGLNKTPAEQAANRAAVGMADPEIAAFLAEAEFISLGNYCGIGYGLESVGLRKNAYPFDWVRSPARGIIQLFNNDFKDFFTYGSTEQTDHGPAFHNTAWGGSFWHHDIQNEKVKASFQRRIDRILGRGDVPDTVPRVFVRTLNSTSELASCVELHRTLQAKFSKTKVYLLVLVEMQDEAASLRLAGPAGDRIFFHRVPVSFAMTADIGVRAKGYLPGITAAVRYWVTGKGMPVQNIKEFRQLHDAFDAFEGKDPATQLYAPVRIPATPPTPMPPAVVFSPPPTVASGSHPGMMAAVAGKTAEKGGLSSAATPPAASPAHPGMIEGIGSLRAGQLQQPSFAVQAPQAGSFYAPPAAAGPGGSSNSGSLLLPPAGGSLRSGSWLLPPVAVNSF
eukprot:CAMPEP_0178444130 /NCGR_PEP_ID=MMETSP0689_2-20121128/39316_1 /TAXON_ID=160604 /ORGANISM="Amphidinium massartii, Strain CS-259" /LENGTH=492 /DNA_ID=CAMNT_0020068287 /DNA_START=124 /DNA_END=1602 /DNA_ORIENTATION=-